MSLEEIMELRRDTSGLYFIFLEYFLSSVVGKNHYKLYRCERLVSEFTTVSDEALAILIYENNIDTWKDMVDKNITKNSSVTKKYTNGGTSKGEVASSRRYQGWSSNGIKRFNELFDLIRADCNSSHAVSFEESFQQFCIDGGVSGKGRKRTAPLFEAVPIRHELWDDIVDSNLGGEECGESRRVSNDQCDIDSLHQTNNDDEEENDDSDDDEDPFGTYGKNVAV